MKKLYLACIASALAAGSTFAQNVGIGIAAPVEKLDVAGAIKISGTQNAAPQKGTIRWNEARNDFEGYNGTSWVSLTGGRNGWGNGDAPATESEFTTLRLGTGNNPGKELGYSLATTDSLLVVGARRNHYNVGDVGSVFFFRKTGGNWIRLSSASPNDYSGGDLFGSAVAIGGGFVMAGAPGAVVTNGQNQGRAYIYAYDNGGFAGSPLVLALGAPKSNDQFGAAVAINAAYAFVGAPGRDVGVFPSVTNGAGRVYIYQRSGSSWPQLTSLSAPDVQPDAGFGATLTFWNDYLAVGCPFFDTADMVNVGKVYLYRRSGSQWNLVAQVANPQLNINGFFGRAISFHNGWLVVGAPNDGEDDAGFVSAYSLNGNTTTLHSTWWAPPSRKGDRFGWALSQAGNVLLVGSPHNEDETVQRQEKAYAYELRNNQWVLQASLVASHNEGAAHFGMAVALLPGQAAIGAPLADVGTLTDNGRIYFFKR